MHGGPAGATGAYGVAPDIVCLAKAMGGGVSCGAIGGTEEVMAHIVEGRYDQVGTFNGNPLVMAAARAALTEVLTADTYRRFDRLRGRIVAGLEAIIERHGLGSHVVAIGAKGCVTFSPDPVRNYRDFLRIDDRLSHCHWLLRIPTSAQNISMNLGQAVAVCLYEIARSRHGVLVG